MKFPTKWLALPVVCLSMVPPTDAATVTVTPAERDAMVATTSAAAAKALKVEAAQLRVVPEQIKRHGNWVFLTAQMQDPAGKRFDYAGTDRHDAAQAGGVSSLCVALLHSDGTVWKLVELAVGPTDVAWEGWAAAHKAPAELFQ
ncbi:hypothetical protein FVQ98_17730 [Ottowia sp. GY511]|uniref:Uncharacterized protein n=1 Tax=Ottowia flava TaxID=2675430 RepID=A0ABW4KX17_9BURK|nr:hypothetical protein [Ottowia sp. GY511]TXK23297.1 hypothetical protein FVQ98_17730 [Ottowia sp. GY511]